MQSEDNEADVNDWREQYQNRRPSTNPIDTVRSKPGHLREVISVFNEGGLFIGAIAVERSIGNSVMWIGLADIDEERFKR